VPEGRPLADPVSRRLTVQDDPLDFAGGSASGRPGQPETDRPGWPSPLCRRAGLWPTRSAGGWPSRMTLSIVLEGRPLADPVSRRLTVQDDPPDCAGASASGRPGQPEADRPI